MNITTKKENTTLTVALEGRLDTTTAPELEKQGKMIIRNVCDDIKEIFEITGFLDILTIE